MASFLVSSSHKTFVKENRRFGGGAIVESVVSVAFFRPTYTSSSTTLTITLVRAYPFIRKR